MQTLSQNIIGVFGEQGRDWLGHLPLTVKALSKHWGLVNLQPVDNMTFNYVAKAQNTASQPVILKISCDAKLIQAEKQALDYFEGCGAIKMLASHEECNALLLQQAIPGTTLKSLYPKQSELVLNIYADTATQLHRKWLHKDHRFHHIREWLKSLDNVKPGQLPNQLLKKAIHLKNELLATAKHETFLHGDLHLDNILEHGNDWLAIDPKGIVGEPAFEIAAFDFISPDEMKSEPNLPGLLHKRVEYLAEKTHLNAQRIKDWVFVRLLLAAAWWVEDRGDPSGDIALAERLFLD